MTPSEVDSIVEWALRHSAAAETEIHLVEERSSVLRFVDSKAAQHVSEQDWKITLRAADGGGRIGLAACNTPTKNALRDALDAAWRSARALPAQSDWVPLSPPIQSGRARPQTFAVSTNAIDPRETARRLAHALQPLEPHFSGSGYLRTASIRETVTNSRGMRQHEDRTRVDFRVTVSSGMASGYAAETSIDVDTINLSALVDEARQRVSASRGTVDVDPGEFAVVFSPYAVARLLDFLAFFGFSGRAVVQGLSPFRLGQHVAHSAFSVWDDGWDPAGLPVTFDAEGVPKQRVELIRDGQVVGHVYDLVTAHRAGVRSTGHALPAGNEDSPACLNLFVAPGARSVDDMISSMSRGLLVTRLHYVNVVDHSQLMLTGITRDGTFVVEEGQIRARARDLRFNQGVLAALSGAMESSRETRLLSSDFYGVFRVPFLRFERWQFAG